MYGGESAHHFVILNSDNGTLKLTSLISCCFCRSALSYSCVVRLAFKYTPLCYTDVAFRMSAHFMDVPFLLCKTLENIAKNLFLQEDIYKYIFSFRAKTVADGNSITLFLLEFTVFYRWAILCKKPTASMCIIIPKLKLHKKTKFLRKYTE